jgi:two-component system, cell cycle sensor histidine kinase and response regulator CckA
MTENHTHKHRKYTILIAEDSPTQVEFIRSILEDNGFNVVVASDGRQALEQTRALKPDAVISDIIMPHLGGYELCEAIKHDPELHGTPVILLTALSDPADVVRGLSAGADNFIIKPFDEEYLIARVSSILSSRKIAEHEPLRVAIEITFAGQTFTIDADRLQILNVLLSTYETAVQRNLELVKTQAELRGLTETLEQKVRERTAALEAEVRERRSAQEALEKQSKILQSVVESMGDALVVADETGRLLLFNPAARQMLGVDAVDVPPEQWSEQYGLFLPDQTTPHPADQLPLARALRGEQVDLHEIFVRNPQRPEGLIISVTARPIRDATDAIRGGVAVFRDITEQKELEARMLRAQRMESVGALAGGVAHDLNNVLAPILMASEMLPEFVNDDSMAVEMVNTVQKSARRGADLVKQLLTFARGSSGQRTLLQLKHQIRELVRVAEGTFPKSIEIRIDLPSELWPVMADATQMDQVLLNLCVNARDAMPDGGSLSIQAENTELIEEEVRPHPGAMAGPYVVVSVTDTGEGMSPDVIERLFEPFFTTKARGKGTGLGLSTTLGILKGHGGFVTVQSRPGHGTTFRVHLPAVRSATEESAVTDHSRPPDGHGELILIVDDEEAIRAVAKGALERHGYRALVAEDGAAAVGIFAQRSTEVVLAFVDMAMPVMDGVATVRALRKIDPAARIIIMSGLEENLSEEDLAGLGVAGRLAKPCGADLLLRTVHAQLHPAPPAGANPAAAP